MIARDLKKKLDLAHHFTVMSLPKIVDIGRYELPEVTLSTASDCP